MIGYAKNAVVVDSNSPECLAKELGEEAKTYHIKVDRSQGGMLYDPNEDIGSSVKIKGTNLEKYTFTTVSSITFDLYIKYLKSGNKSNLTQANRNLKWS